MRDPRRIKKVLKEIEESWLDFPDWRFGQWFSNVIENQDRKKAVPPPLKV
jgi:hypothetical protein